MPERIVLAGGTGFLGQFLARRFADAGCSVQLISRKNGHARWANFPEIVAALDGSQLLINLAGRSINCLFTEKNRAEILQSRLETTQLLARALSECKAPPPLWVNASGATSGPELAMTEANNLLGDSFLATVVARWEQVFFEKKLEKTRRIALRLPPVLGRGGGVFPRFKWLAKTGLGGAQGHGNQWVSWVHQEDIFRAIQFLRENPNLVGPVVCAAPTPLRNRDFMRTFRQIFQMPIGLPAPAWLLKMAAPIVQTDPELLLGSCHVLPEKLLASGFQFEFPKLENCLADLAEGK